MSTASEPVVTYHVSCPVCGRTHSFTDPGVDLNVHKLVARRLCVDLHARRDVIAAGGTIEEALGLGRPADDD